MGWRNRFIEVMLIFVLMVELFGQADTETVEYSEWSESNEDEVPDCPNFTWYGSWYFDILPYIESFEYIHLSDDHVPEVKTDLKSPVIIWWTGFTEEKGRIKRCGHVKCFFTVDRQYKDHQQTKAFMFYGTDFQSWDLPLPRKSHHEWALFHEESPKNNYLFSHSEIMEMFNHTATFRRESDVPLSTQYLKSTKDLESKKYLVPTSMKSKLLKEGRVSLINYVQSDCNTPSDRDHFVQMLQRHMKVDSYGACEHNKDLPEHLSNPVTGMDHEEFYKLLATYKFTIAMENGVCSDYITEKFWRPFIVGSVPIIFGSPTSKEFLPNNHSAIFVDDYENISDIVELIRFLDENDSEYEEYLKFKTEGVTNEYLKQILHERPWSIGNDYTKPNLVDAFECVVCRRIHDNIQLGEQGQQELKYSTNKDHYGCPKPKRFSDIPPGNINRVEDDWWSTEWLAAKFEAIVLKESLRKGKILTKTEIEKLTEIRLLDYLNRNSRRT